MPSVESSNLKFVNQNKVLQNNTFKVYCFDIKNANSAFDQSHKNVLSKTQ
jgi:hypothetical protein